MVQKLADTIRAKHYITTLIKHILSTNYVQVNDNLTTSKPIKQTIGILQRDPLSPLLFNLSTMDIIKAVRKDKVKVFIYVDEMTILSESLKVTSKKPVTI
ncbi:hypothetical protein ANN_09508 [Periplaneta americana]|uniref:Reverse transcriptase domain-containing protein n=1 Tax=Periplaneta americana TaxID=6978 RepID=A0ABQ8TN08_PERAM|nr:hypothetical protein ANN_09508 [Periplaneta americana]